MELDGRDAAGSSLEPEQGAIAEPHCYGKPSRLKNPRHPLRRKPIRMPMSRKAAVRQRYPGMTNGKIRLRAALAASLQNYAEWSSNPRSAWKTKPSANWTGWRRKRKTLAAAVAANAAAMREFAGAEGRQPEAGGTAEPHKDENRTTMADFHRWADAQRGYRLRWSTLALAIVVPAFFLLGVLVELQFQIIPAHDPSGGWSRHIWDNYGPAIADCAMEAKRADRAVKCSLDVRKP